MPRPEANIDHATQKAVSYSQYSMYSQCQYQWYLSYACGHSSFKPSIYLTYGTSLHETLQEYLDVMFNKSIKEADELDLNKMLEDRMVSNYKQSLVENKNEHFSNKDQMREFIEDGQLSLDWFKKNRSRYFTRKNTHLVGIEIPILRPVTDNVFIRGFIDFIIYEKILDKYTIFDIKTSTRGWSDKDKKDQTKINQILFYKRFYSEMLNVSEDRIEVKFFIVKRKVFSNPDYPIYRIQEFIPASGKKKVEDAIKDLNLFVSHCFTKDAKHNIDQVYIKNLDACKYCAFKDRNDLCDKKS